MRTIYDIYDSTTFRIVKQDITLTKKGTHKDLKKGRYVKIRIGLHPEQIDYDSMTAKLHNLSARVEILENILSQFYEQQKLLE